MYIHVVEHFQSVFTIFDFVDLESLWSRNCLTGRTFCWGVPFYWNTKLSLRYCSLYLIMLAYIWLLLSFNNCKNVNSKYLLRKLIKIIFWRDSDQNSSFGFLEATFEQNLINIIKVGFYKIIFLFVFSYDSYPKFGSIKKPKTRPELWSKYDHKPNLIIISVQVF